MRVICLKIGDVATSYSMHTLCQEVISNWVVISLWSAARQFSYGRLAHCCFRAPRRNELRCITIYLLKSIYTGCGCDKTNKTTSSMLGTPCSQGAHSRGKDYIRANTNKYTHRDSSPPPNSCYGQIHHYTALVILNRRLFQAIRKPRVWLRLARECQTMLVEWAAHWHQRKNANR